MKVLKKMKNLKIVRKKKGSLIRRYNLGKPSLLLLEKENKSYNRNFIILILKQSSIQV